MRFYRYAFAAALIGGLCVIAGCQSAALTSAKLYMQENEPERALEQLEKAREADPDNPEVYYLLARVHGNQGSLETAAEALSRASVLDGEGKLEEEIASVRRELWARVYNRGIEQADPAQPDYDAANASFELATQVDPTQVSAWRNLAFTYYQLDELPAAIEAYQRAVEIAPDDSTTLSNLATMLSQEERYPEAIEVLEQLVAIAPDAANAYVNLGSAYQQTDQTDAAREAYKQAVAVDPTLAVAHYGLGNLYWNSEDFDAARDSYLAALEQDPGFTDARFNLAMVYLQTEDDVQAQPLLEQLASEIPDNGAVWRHLSLIYARQDLVKKATEADARAKELGF